MKKTTVLVMFLLVAVLASTVDVMAQSVPEDVALKYFCMNNINFDERPSLKLKFKNDQFYNAYYSGFLEGKNKVLAAKHGSFSVVTERILLDMGSQGNKVSRSANYSTLIESIYTYLQLNPYDVLSLKYAIVLADVDDNSIDPNRRQKLEELKQGMKLQSISDLITETLFFAVFVCNEDEGVIDQLLFSGCYVDFLFMESDAKAFAYTQGIGKINFIHH
jgi:hypothetical protein